MQYTSENIEIPYQNAEKYFDELSYLENNQLDSFNVNIDIDDIPHTNSYGHNSTISIASSNQGKKRKSLDSTDSEINELDNSNKKRFLWPESLHRDFIAAVFDIGLKLATPAKLKELLPDVNIATNEEMATEISKFKLYRQQKRSLDYQYIHQHNGSDKDKNNEENMKIIPKKDKSKKSKHQVNKTKMELNNLTMISIERANCIVTQIESIGSALNTQSEYITNLKQSFSKQIKLYTQLTIKAAELKNFMIENSSFNTDSENTASPIIQEMITSKLQLPVFTVNQYNCIQEQQLPHTNTSISNRNDYHIYHNTDNNSSNSINATTTLASSAIASTGGSIYNMTATSAAEEMTLLQLIREKSQRSINNNTIGNSNSNNDIDVTSSNMNSSSSSNQAYQYNNYHDSNILDHHNNYQYNVKEEVEINKQLNSNNSSNTSTSFELATTARAELNIMHEMRAQMNIHRQLLMKKQDQLSLHCNNNNNNSSNNNISTITSNNTNFHQQQSIMNHSINKNATDNNPPSYSGNTNMNYYPESALQSQSLTQYNSVDPSIYNSNRTNYFDNKVASMSFINDSIGGGGAGGSSGGGAGSIVGQYPHSDQRNEPTVWGVAQLQYDHRNTTTIAVSTELNKIQTNYISTQNSNITNTDDFDFDSDLFSFLFDSSSTV